MDIGKYIKELLFLHDCVILPGLGGFVANYRPAVFDPGRHTASPPSKHILFNPSLVHNDGLLYAHISAVSAYGYKDVENMTGQYVREIRDKIGQGGKFEIKGLGYFYLDGEKQIRFTGEPGQNFLLESFGLPFLQYREFDRIPRPETYRVLHTEADPQARQKRIRRWIYAAAAACILSAMVLIPVRNGYFSRAGMDLAAGDSFLKEQSHETAEQVPGTLKATAGIAGQEGMAPFQSSTRSRTLPAREYHLVVGSFHDFGNARSLRNRLVQEGYKARILSSGQGWFRVSAGTYPIREEAAENLTALRKEFETAWLLSD